MRCRYRAEDGPVRVNIEYLIAKGRVCQKVTVENQGERELELMDLAVCLACHTDFRWDENAGQNVIGHHFIAGHGSHSTFCRCDGEGDILAALPENQTEFLYYETDDDGVGDNRKKNGVTWLYCLNRAVSRNAVEKGSRLRIPPKSLRVLPGECTDFSWSFRLVGSYEACRELFIEQGQPVVESIPGYTVPEDLEVRLCIRSREQEICLKADREGTWIKRKRNCIRRFRKTQMEVLFL